jgi:hypothetical protein
MRIKRKPTAVLLAVLTLLAAAGIGYRRHVGSPAYALKQIGRAIEQRDRMAFERHVDVPALAKSTVDDMLAEAVADEMADAQNQGEAMRAGLVAGLAVLESAKPALVSTMRAMLLDAVEKGEMQGLLAPDGADQGTPHFANLLRNQVGPRVRFAGMGRVRRSGKLATAELLMHDAPADTTLPLRLRLDRGEDGWRVVGFDNLREYLDESDRVHQAVVAANNRMIERRIAKAVNIGSPAVRIEPGLYGAEVMYIDVPVRNVGPDTVTTVDLVLEQYGQVIDDFNARLHLYENVAPGESATATTMLVYNGYLEWHSAVRYGTVTPRVVTVMYARNGRLNSLEKVSGWEEYAEKVPEPAEPASPRSEARM